jgi:hypothetical protein
MLSRYASFLTPLKEAAKQVTRDSKSRTMQAIARAARSIPEFIPMTSSRAKGGSSLTKEERSALPKELEVAKLPGVDIPEKDPEEFPESMEDEEILGPGMSLAELARKAESEVPLAVQQRIQKLVETSADGSAARSRQSVASTGGRGERTDTLTSRGTSATMSAELLAGPVETPQSKPKGRNSRSKKSSSKG